MSCFFTFSSLVSLGLFQICFKQNTNLEKKNPWSWTEYMILQKGLGKHQVFLQVASDLRQSVVISWIGKQCFFNKWHYEWRNVSEEMPDGYSFILKL